MLSFWEIIELVLCLMLIVGLGVSVIWMLRMAQEVDIPDNFF